MHDKRKLVENFEHWRSRDLNLDGIISSC